MLEDIHMKLRTIGFAAMVAALTTLSSAALADNCTWAPQPDGSIAIAGDPRHPANFGRLCSKGAALGETLSLKDRLLRPKIHGRETGWDEAVAEHEAMIDALVRRDGGALAAILRAHLEHKYEAIQALAAGGEGR